MFLPVRLALAGVLVCANSLAAETPEAKEATRAATINPPNTGPNSRTMPIAVIEGTANSAENRADPAKICKASAPPVNSAVRPTTGRDNQPICTNCAPNSRA